MNITKIAIKNNHFRFLLCSHPKAFGSAWLLCGNTEFVTKIYLRKMNSRFHFPLDVIGNFLFGKEGSPVASYTVQILLI